MYGGVGTWVGGVVYVGWCGGTAGVAFTIWFIFFYIFFSFLLNLISTRLRLLFLLEVRVGGFGLGILGLTGCGLPGCGLGVGFGAGRTR